MFWLKKIWNAEYAPISERYRVIGTAFMALLAVVYVINIIATMHFLFLGPGLGEDITFAHFYALLEQALSFGWRHGIGPLPFFVLVASFMTSTAYRGWIYYRAYREHEQCFGHPLPLSELSLYLSINVLNILFTPLLLFVLGIIAVGLGYTWGDAWNVMTRLRSLADQGIAQVPTLVDWPPFVAFIASTLAVSFIHYWMHRVSHTHRFMWLVFHRPHHMTEEISPSTTLSTVMSFPLFLLMMVPYLFGFGAITKLFCSEPPYAATILFQLCYLTIEMYNHSAALYASAVRKRWVRWYSFIFCAGLYHVLHHASDRDARYRHVEYTSNLGPGLFFCWDILFGTYRPLPSTLPSIGLTDNPRLLKNPLRLLVSGAAQIAYELYWNKSWRTRARILLGTADYFPPISRDFALHSDLEMTNAAIEIGNTIIRRRTNY